MKNEKLPQDSTESGNTELIERKSIEHTPFVGVKAEGKWFLTMGRFRLNDETHETWEELIESITRNQWNLIATMAGIISEFNINEANK